MSLKNKMGFTLIEVIISIAIIAIIGVLLSNLVSTTVKARNVSLERLKILAACTSYMNEMRSLKDDFSSEDDVENFLDKKGFSKEADVFKKSETNNIMLEITINKNIDKSGLYEILIIGKSSNVNEISISSVIKGGNLN